jgi:hypothetical protein
MVDAAEIARLVGIEESSVRTILNRIPGPVFHEETIRRVFQIADGLGFSAGDPKQRRHRRAVRWKTEIPSRCALYAQDGSVLDRGRCVIADIAVFGASVTNLELSEGKLPLRLLAIDLEFTDRGLPIEVSGHVVRMNMVNDSVSLGIAFQEVGPALRERIAAVGH